MNEATDSFYAGPVRIVSDMMKGVLQRFDVHAEFLELVALHRGQPYRRKKLFLLNILDAVECFDFQSSQYMMTEHGASGVEKLVLDEVKATGHHLFQVGP